MARALSVARLTPDADLGKVRSEGVVRRVVILRDPGRVTLRTHEVPVLIQPGPMQDVIVPDRLVGVEVEPALAAFILRSRVPGDRQRLDTAIRELDQVLLQRVDAEG